MSTNYPGALDSYAALVDGTDILEAADQNNVRDAIEAMQARMGVTTSGVATSHDYRIAQLEDGVVTYANSTVFNASLTAANTFQDLDLSGTVGANVAMVALEVSFTLNGGLYVIKPKGYGSATLTQHWQSGGSPCGGNVVVGDSAVVYGYIVTPTDADGKLSHAMNSAATTVTVKMHSWWK